MESRSDQIRSVAADLFAARGFHGVSVTDIGAACGISGPALYKHFVSKQALLADMLVTTSRWLLEGGRGCVAGAAEPAEAVAALIDHHVGFALEHRALIVVQDRDWESLTEDARSEVRALQRAYVEVWADVLRAWHGPEVLAAAQARAMAHAAFGLINSTPHSGLLPNKQMQPVLAQMALAALSPV